MRNEPRDEHDGNRSFLDIDPFGDVRGDRNEERSDAQPQGYPSVAAQSATENHQSQPESERETPDAGRYADRGDPPNE